MDETKLLTIDLRNINRAPDHGVKAHIQKEIMGQIYSILVQDLRREVEEGDNINRIREHSAIFINGERGSGKTQLLVNIRAYLGEMHGEMNRDFHFFDSIDPTLHHDNEHFLTIILARMLNDLAKQERESHHKQEQEQEHFYKNLNNIAKAIDGAIKNNNYQRTSLENISQDQTSLRLEEYMHEFFKNVTKLLKKKRLILLIDDVDMAFERGFDVLEVVRKYLSSPYIIPIITGDLQLYKTIVTNHFIGMIGINRIRTFLNKHPRLVDDYLSKVIPMHRRAKIKTLYDLSKENNIEFVYGEGREDKYCIKCPKCEHSSCVKYFRVEAKDIFDSEEFGNRFVENLFSNPLRNVLQFLYSQFVVKQARFDQLTIADLTRFEEEYNLELIKNILTDKTYLDRALTSYAIGEYQSSIKLAIEANKIKESADTYLVMAKSYHKLKDFISAKESYEKTIELDLYRAEAYTKLGYLYRNKLIESNDETSYSKAIEYFNKSLEIESTYDAHNGLGAALLCTEEYEKAIEEFKKATSINPNVVTAYLNIIESSFLDNTIDENYCTPDFEKSFLWRFDGDAKAMLIYDMTKILKNIEKGEKEEEIKKQYEAWNAKYPAKVYMGKWSFELTKKYIDDIKDNEIRERLQRYFEKFLSKTK